MSAACLALHGAASVRSVSLRLLVAAAIWILLSTHALAASITAEFSAGLGEFRSIVAISSSTVFAGSRGGGLWRSNDSGLDWFRVTQFPSNYIWQLARDTSNAARIFAATDDGLYRSLDSGTSWQMVLGAPSRSVAVSPTGTLVLVGVLGVGVLRSGDGGSTFARSSAGLDSAQISSIAFRSATEVYVAASANLMVVDFTTGTTGPTPWGGVFRSTDGGQTWFNISQPTAGTAISSRYVVSLAVGTSGFVLAASRDPTGNGSGRIHRFDGASWFNPADNDQAAGHIYDIETVHIDVNDGNQFWAGTRSLGPFRSSDGGVSWTRFQNIPSDPALLTGVQAFGTIPTNATRVLMAPRGLGVFRVESANTVAPSNALWQRVAGIAADRALALTETLSAGVNLVGYVGAGIWWFYPARVPSSAPAYWGLDPVNYGAGAAPSMHDVSSLAVEAGSGALALFAENGGVHTYNGSTGTWTKLPFSGGTSPTPRGLAFSGTGVLFSVDHYRGLQRYAGGWQSVLAGWSGGTGLGRLIPSRFVASRLYLMQFDSQFADGSGSGPGYVSSDNGTTWLPMRATHVGFSRLGLKDLVELTANESLGITNKGLFRSTDGGKNWSSSRTTGLEELHLRSIVLRSGVFWAVSASNAVYCSLDGGYAWQKTSVVTRARATRLASVPDGLFALTDGAGVSAIGGTCP